LAVGALTLVGVPAAGVLGATAASAAGTLTQIAPTSGFTDFGVAFAAQLHVTGNTGAVTYTTTGGSGGVTVSGTGAVKAPATLALGTYTASGTDADTHGDMGSWSFSLHVTQATTFLQAHNTSSSLFGITFSATLKASGHVLGGQAIIFSMPNGGPGCTGTTDALGVAKCTVKGVFVVGSQPYDALYIGNAEYAASSSTATIGFGLL
jgi:hypothetical protein